MSSIEDALAQITAGDLPTRGGTTWAYVYDPGSAAIDEVGAKAYAAMLDTNALDPTAFPSVLALEKEVVATVAGVLGGGVGVFTSGGTESSLLAVKAAAGGPGGEIVLPVTAHPAFHKAAHYFGLTPVVVPVDEDFRAVPAAVADAVTDRTVLVVASAPNYPTGTVDPVPEIAAIAAERGVGCHVDAAIGGWILPFLDDAPPFDLSVPGVTSLTVDLHKYAYTPKGASVLLFRDAELRRRAWFAYAGWPGYPMINPTMQSARSAGPLGAAWAVLRHVGPDGYRSLARDARRALLTLAAGVGRIDGLRVIGVPDSTLLAVAGPDVFSVAEELKARGHYAQVQLSLGDVPPTLHFSAHAVSTSTVDGLLTALAESVAAARPVPLPPLPDLATIDEAGFGQLLAETGGSPAVINAVLDAQTPAVRERLMMLFLSAVL